MMRAGILPVLFASGIPVPQDVPQDMDVEPSHLGAWRGSIHGLETPVAVAVGPADRIHVVEAGAHRVRVFDVQGTELARLGRPRSWRRVWRADPWTPRCWPLPPRPWRTR